MTVKLGGLVGATPLVPSCIEAVAAWLRVNPPVPEKVQLVAIDISRTSVAAVVLVRAILPVPKEIARIFELFELNTPVLKILLFKVKVPE